MSGDLVDEFNDAMISRLEGAYANNSPIEGADLDFYAHEIYESTLVKNGMKYTDNQKDNVDILINYGRNETFFQS